MAIHPSQKLRMRDNYKVKQRGGQWSTTRMTDYNKDNNKQGADEQG